MVPDPRAPLRTDRLRPLNLPQPVNVVLDKLDLPSAIEENGTRKTVDAIIDTWRIDDEWWREPIARRYVEVVLNDGGHVVLYEDLTNHTWFLQMP